MKVSRSGVAENPKLRGASKCGRCGSLLKVVSLTSEVTTEFLLCEFCCIGERGEALQDSYHLESFHDGRPIAIEFFRKRSRLQLEFIRQCYGQLPVSLHDFGTGNGFFIDHCQSHGVATHFSEVDERLQTKLKARGHQLWDETTDVVHHHLSHSLEHLENPLGLLINLRKSSQSLFIEVPNEYVRTSEHGLRRIGDGHLWLFSKKSLSELVVSAGWTILRIETVSKNFVSCHETDEAATWIRLFAM